MAECCFSGILFGVVDSVWGLSTEARAGCENFTSVLDWLISLFRILCSLTRCCIMAECVTLLDMMCGTCPLGLKQPARD